jgi:hypothetical protein
MYKQVLSVLQGEYVDLSSLKNHRGWAYLFPLGKLTDAQKMIILAILNEGSNVEDFMSSAGIGSPAKVREVKDFWGRIAHKIISIPRFRESYRSALDSLYKANERGDLSGDAEHCLRRGIRANDEEVYRSGKLPIKHLRLKAKIKTMQLFMEELYSFCNG